MMRLNRFLAACGFGSRRSVEHLIVTGLVKVNGQTCLELATQVSETDQVTVSGKAAALPVQSTCVLMNKPAGYLCSRTDPAGKPLVFELLPVKWRSLHYVGRLDFLSRGALLFTDDGALTQALLHPSREVERVYEVVTDTPLEPQSLASLRTGLTLEDGLRTMPAKVRKLPHGSYELTLREGKNREIRRMMMSLGHRVKDLRRLSYGPIDLEDLAEGHCRALTPEEIQSLRLSCGIEAAE